MSTLRFIALWHDDKRLRRCLLVLDLCLFAFWGYSVAYILNHPAPKGSDGFEVFMVIPMTGIAILFSIPATLLVFPNRTLRVSVLVTLASIIANGIVGSDLLWNSGLGRGAYWPLW